MSLPGLALAICRVTGYSQPSDGKTHITYWEKWSGAEAAALQTVVEQFNRPRHRIVGFLDTANVDRETTARPAILRAG